MTKAELKEAIKRELSGNSPMTFDELYHRIASTTDATIVQLMDALREMGEVGSVQTRVRELKVFSLTTMHAHDRLIKAGQKTVTTVCGKVAKVGESVIITDHEHMYDPAARAYNCVGCIAVLKDRATINARRQQ